VSTILIQCDVGDAVVVRGTLTDEAGDPVVGADVTARAIAPGATAETDLGACTDEGEGVYAVVLEPDVAGAWHVRMESADPEKAAAEGIVYARETRFS
jgi:nitrogen fixation protein FixH